MNYENKRKFTMSKAHKSKLYKVIAVTSAMAMICGMSACAKKSAVDSETTKSTMWLQRLTMLLQKRNS